MRRRREMGTKMEMDMKMEVGMAMRVEMEVGWGWGFAVRRFGDRLRLALEVELAVWSRRRRDSSMRCGHNMRVDLGDFADGAGHRPQKGTKGRALHSWSRVIPSKLWR